MEKSNLKNIRIHLVYKNNHYFLKIFMISEKQSFMLQILDAHKARIHGFGRGKKEIVEVTNQDHLMSIHYAGLTFIKVK
ncbi:hypothetical protein N7603_02145 [Acholeplasma vituli]|uniref:Uncharacterized protein n=2 Tax=Paracholeplasma vituli TaxID=69473 RepID=A0ABT2PU39_9MOLU|nr:hypothetical protein [Paracholeplasma vituli]